MMPGENTTSLFALRLLTASNLERLLASQNSTTTRTGSIRFDDDEVWIPVLVFSILITILITILIVFLLKHYTIKNNLKIQLQRREQEVEEVEEDEKEKKTSIHIANTGSVIEEDETKKSILKCPRCQHVLDVQTTPSPRSEEEMEEGTDKETTENNNGLEEEEEEEEEEFVKEMKKKTETVTSVTADSDKEKQIAAKKQRKKDIMDLAIQEEKETKEKDEMKKNNSLKI